MRQRASVLLQVGPGHVLGLVVVRGDVGEAGIGLAAAQGSVYQVHDTSHRLTGAAMSDDAGPSLRPLVERDELGAGAIP